MSSDSSVLKGVRAALLFDLREEWFEPDDSDNFSSTDSRVKRLCLELTKGVRGNYSKLLANCSFSDFTHTVGLRALSPLHIAAMIGNDDAARKMLDKGHGFTYYWGDSKGWTPVHFAAARRDLKMIKLFQEYLGDRCIYVRTLGGLTAEEILRRTSTPSMFGGTFSCEQNGQDHWWREMSPSRFKAVTGKECVQEFYACPEVMGRLWNLSSWEKMRTTYAPESAPTLGVRGRPGWNQENGVCVLTTVRRGEVIGVQTGVLESELYKGFQLSNIRLNTSLYCNLLALVSHGFPNMAKTAVQVHGLHVPGYLALDSLPKGSALWAAREDCATHLRLRPFHEPRISELLRFFEGFLLDEHCSQLRDSLAIRGGRKGVEHLQLTAALRYLALTPSAVTYLLFSGTMSLKGLSQLFNEPEFARITEVEEDHLAFMQGWIKTLGRTKQKWAHLLGSDLVRNWLYPLHEKASPWGIRAALEWMLCDPESGDLINETEQLATAFSEAALILQSWKEDRNADRKDITQLQSIQAGLQSNAQRTWFAQYNRQALREELGLDANPFG